LGVEGIEIRDLVKDKILCGIENIKSKIQDTEHV